MAMFMDGVAPFLHLAEEGIRVGDWHGSPNPIYKPDLLISRLGIHFPRLWVSIQAPFFGNLATLLSPFFLKCQSLTQGVKICIPENFSGSVSIHFKHLSKLSFLSAPMGHSKTWLPSSWDELVWMVSSEFPLITSDFWPEELPLVYPGFLETLFTVDLLQFFTCSLRIHCCCRLLWWRAWSLDANSCLLSSFNEAIVLYSIVTTRKCFPLLGFKGPLLSLGIKLCIGCLDWGSRFIPTGWMALNSNRSIEPFKFLLSFKVWDVREHAVTSYMNVFADSVLKCELLIVFREFDFFMIEVSIPDLCLVDLHSGFLIFSELLLACISGRNVFFLSSSIFGGHGIAMVNCRRSGEGFFLVAHRGELSSGSLKRGPHWEWARGNAMISMLV